MKIVSSRLLRGPNVHAERPRLLAIVDAGSHSRRRVDAVPTLAERLAAALRGAGSTAPLDASPAGDRLVPQLVPALVDALQALAGTPVAPGRSWPVEGAASQHWALCAYEHEAVVELALSTAVDALARLVDGADTVDLAGPVAALRALVAARAIDAGSRRLLDAARARGVPLLRLDDAERRFQLGWGRRQRRVEAQPAGAPAVDLRLDAVFSAGDDGRIPTVAITGTNGKTTTTQLVSHLLRASGAFGNVGTTTTQGVYIGEVPVEHGDCTGYWSARRLLTDEGVDTAVLETARGGILKRGLAFDRCDVGVVLNVSADHLGLDGVRTLDDLAVVKGLVARSASRVAVLNAQDPRCAAMASTLRPGCVPAWFSMDAGDPLVAAQREAGGRAAWLAADDALVLAAGRESHRLLAAADMPFALGGHARYNVANALAAAAAAHALGLGPEAIAAGLASFVSDARRNPLRSNRFAVGGRQVLVDYAHNLAAYRALCDTARALLGGRGRLVGVMTSPGDRRADDLAEVGALCGSRFDELVVYEHDPRGRGRGETVEAILAGARRTAGTRPLHARPAIRDAFELGLRLAGDGDLVVFTCAGGLDDVLDGVRRVDRQAAERIAAELAA